MCFVIRVGPQRQAKLARLQQLEDRLLQHPLSLYPHLKEGIPSEVIHVHVHVHVHCSFSMLCIPPVYVYMCMYIVITCAHSVIVMHAGSWRCVGNTTCR